MGQLVAVLEVEVAVVEVELTWTLLEGRTLVDRDITGAPGMRVLLAKPVTLLNRPDAVVVTVVPEAADDGQLLVLLEEAD